MSLVPQTRKADILKLPIIEEPVSDFGIMINQLRLEFLKLVRSRSFSVSFVALALFVALMLWGFYSYAERKAGEQVTSQFKYTYESKSYFNGLTFALYSVMFSFSLLIPVFVAMTAGAQIAGEAAGRYVIAKLNVDENPVTAERFRIQSIPALLIFRNGREVDRIVGAQSKPEILRRIQPILT